MRGRGSSVYLEGIRDLDWEGVFCYAGFSQFMSTLRKETRRRMRGGGGNPRGVG